MLPEAKKYLFDAAEAARSINGFVHGKSFEEYSRDALLRAGVERKFEIIGEALSKLRKIDAQCAARVSHLKQIIGLRNVLIHAYDIIADDTIWDIVEISSRSWIESSKFYSAPNEVTKGGTFRLSTWTLWSARDSLSVSSIKNSSTNRP